MDDEAETVVAKGKALVFQQPGIAALDRPAVLAKPGAAWLAALVDAGLGAELAAEVAVVPAS